MLLILLPCTTKMSYPNEINDYQDYEDAFVSKYKANLAPRFLGLGIPRGWRPLVESFMDSIAGTDFKAVQIKEKFGGLRIYGSGTNDPVSPEYSKAIEKASHTCAVCGEEGRFRSTNWLAVLCDKHYEESTKN